MVVKLKSTKVLLLIIMMCIPIILTSCWDKIEINNRAFVNAVLIKKNPKDKKSDMISSSLSERDNEKLSVTFGMVNTAEGETGLKIYTHSVTGVTLGDATEKLNSGIARAPFFGHTKLVVLGREIVEDPETFKHIMDDLERNISIDREIQVVMVEDDNITLDDLKVESEQLYSSYLEGVTSKENAIAYTYGRHMGELFNTLRENEGRGAIPIVRKESGNIRVDKVALIHKYSLKEIVGARTIRGYKLFAALNTRVMEYMQLNNFLTTFRLNSIDRNVTYVKGGKYPKYHISYNVIGGVEDYDFSRQIFTIKNQLDVEENSAKLIKSQILEVVNYFQKEIGIDYLGLKEWTEKFHPKEYKRFKEWNEAFVNAEVEVDVKVNLFRYGDSK